MKRYFVYIHFNKHNNKKYIGITCQNPKKRWDCGRGYINNKHFYSAIQKYGWDGFEHIIIKSDMPEECAKTLEKLLIKQYDTTNPNRGYNISSGGEGTSGYKHSAESKRKMSENRKGKTKGIPHSKEHKQRLSDNSGKRKKISKYTLDGEYIETFDSITKAMKSVGGNPSHFARDLKPDGTYKNYIWKYE